MKYLHDIKLSKNSEISDKMASSGVSSEKS